MIIQFILPKRKIMGFDSTATKGPVGKCEILRFGRVPLDLAYWGRVKWIQRVLTCLTRLECCPLQFITWSMIPSSYSYSYHKAWLTYL